MADNPGIEAPIYVESFHQQRRHWYTATDGDAIHRHPVQAAEIWNEYSSIPFPPDPSLVSDMDSAGVVTLRQGVLLTSVAGSTQKYELAVSPSSLEQVITATMGPTAPISGNVGPTLVGGAATGYTPVIQDATGILHPMVSSAWVVDGINHYVEFPYGIPSTMTLPFRLTFFEYTGSLGGTGSGVTLASAGGTTLVTDGAGPSLEVKGLTAGTGIAINVNAGDLEIENTDPASGVTLASTGGTTLVTDGAGPSLEVKGLTAGTGIAINVNAGDLEIENTDPTSGVTLASAGGTTLVTDGAGPSLEVKGLTAGTGIAINVNAGDLEIENTDPASGVTLASTGGTTLVTDGAGPSLEVKGLTAGTGIAINVNAGDLEIENTDPTSGVTLASAGGTTLVTDGAGPSLEVKGLTAGTGITLNVSPTTIEIESTGGGGSSASPWIFYDRKSPGVVGGSYTTATWQTRDITSTENTPGGSVTLAANRLKFVSPGTYHIKVVSMGIDLQECRMRLQNITTATTTLIGMTCHTRRSNALGVAGAIVLHLNGVFSSTDSAHEQEIQIFANDNGPVGGINSTTALGAPVSDGNDEIYLIATVHKIG